jgi:hypothetical protein
VTATTIVRSRWRPWSPHGGQYTYYVWGKVTSGTKQVSIAIVDNSHADYLAGPTIMMLTTVWQRFKIPSPHCQRRVLVYPR